MRWEVYAACNWIEPVNCSVTDISGDYQGIELHHQQGHGEGVVRPSLLFRKVFFLVAHNSQTIAENLMSRQWPAVRTRLLITTHGWKWEKRWKQKWCRDGVRDFSPSLERQDRLRKRETSKFYSPGRAFFFTSLILFLARWSNLDSSVMTMRGIVL